MFSIPEFGGLHFLEAVKFMPHNLASLFTPILFRQEPPKRETDLESLTVAINIF